jgi:hypothetical protein
MMRVRDNIGANSFQNTERKPGDIPAKRVRRLAPAALTRRTDYNRQCARRRFNAVEN